VITDHKIIEFNILRQVRKTNSKIKPMTFRREDFNLLRELLEGMPWESALEGEGT